MFVQQLVSALGIIFTTRVLKCLIIFSERSLKISKLVRYSIISRQYFSNNVVERFNNLICLCHGNYYI